MLSLVTPVVVLENASPGRALARSWRLVNRSFWRVFGITLLAGLIVAIAGGILQLPFTLLGAAAGSGIGGTVILVIGAIAAGTVTRPITAGVTVLLYVDMRMRKEGLDLALRTASGTGQPGSGASGWPARHGAARRRPARPARGRLRHGVAAAVGGPGAGYTSHGRGGPAAVVTLRGAGRLPDGPGGRAAAGPRRAVEDDLPPARATGPADPERARRPAERPVPGGPGLPGRLVGGGRAGRAAGHAHHRRGEPDRPARPVPPAGGPAGGRRQHAQRGRSPAAGRASGRRRRLRGGHPRTGPGDRP